MIKCYKVVRGSRGKLLSAIVSRMEDSSEDYADAILEYAAGKITTANFGGILVFNTLMAAKKFCKHERCKRGELQVWRAVGHEPVELKDWSLNGTVSMREAWDTPPRFAGDWPTGTLAFKSVELVSKIR